MVDRSQPVEPRFPFDVTFQMTLIRLLVEDDGFSTTMGRHVKPFYFENQVLAWAWSYCQRYEEQYGSTPGFHVILHQVGQMDPGLQPMYAATIDQCRQANLQDIQWLKDNVLDFVKRNIFVRTFHECRQLYNTGHTDKCYDTMMEQMEELHRTTWEMRDRSFFYGDLDMRNQTRQSHDIEEDSIPTGFPWLDHILDGGLSKGEVGNWLAYPKKGKTTMLIQHGRAATSIGWRKAFHAVLEGSRQLVENRYDASYMDEFYNRVKRGNIDAQKYESARRQYELMRTLLVVEGFTDRWDYTIKDIYASLKELRIAHGWVPDLIVIDYGDLLNGRHAPYKSGLENGTDAFRDIKSLANRGYGIWTASQAQRPEKGQEDKAHLLRTRQIAGVYEKVRICDFLGTLNQDPAEKRKGVMRLYAEMYRDNEADQVLPVAADLAKMMIKQQEGLQSPSEPDAPVDPKRGYGPGPRQRKAPV